MALDPSIILQTRRMADPMETMGKAMTLRQLATQNELQGVQAQQARDAMARQTRLRDLVAGLPADATPDVRINALRGGGFFDEADKLETSMLGRKKTEAEVGEITARTGKLGAETADQQWKTMKARVDAASGFVSTLLARPNVTHQDVMSAITDLVGRRIIEPDEGAAMARGLPGDPAALRGWLVQKGLETQTAKDRLEATMPRLQEVDTGGAKQFVDVNPITRGAAPTTFKKTATPDAVLSAETTRRGQNMTDARAREANALTRAGQDSAVTWQQDSNGNFVALPARLPAGQTAGVQPVQALGPDGKPVRGKGGDLTDAQSKALLFGGRMREADAALNALAAAGTQSPSRIKQAVEGLPLAGPALGAAANATVATPAQQQVEQAQRDFINAVLRRESGAVIADSEFDNARKQYFPAIGDSPQVIAQKAANRQRAIALMLEEVPQARRGAIDATAAPAAAPARPAPPKVGDVVDGYLFNGGDPANPSSWKKVR